MATIEGRLRRWASDLRNWWDCPRDLTEAAGVIAEMRRALEAAQRRIALMTPFDEARRDVAAECDRVREQIRKALERAGEGGVPSA